MRERANAELVPAEAGAYLNIPLVKLIGWLRQPGGPIIRPGSLIRESFREAVATLKEKLGPDISTWRYGQQRYKHITLRHPLSNAVNEKYRKILEAGPAPRGGYAYTVCATGYDDNQGSGASFRILVNTGNWDETLVMNNPGQSGDPASPYYKNLFQDWAQDRFFPLYFTRNKIDSVAAGVFRLVPH